jgi:AcrR family transcriptional regulator/DNA-binding MarR family transcriptional regulator
VVVLSSGGVARERRRDATVGSVLSRRGDVLVSQTQRARMLMSAAQVIAEHGYGEMSVSRITTGAGVSRRTFYDLFEDREDCFLAAFDDAVAQAREVMRAGSEDQGFWRERVRGALLALLVLLDSEPAMRSLLVLDALKGGPRVQERRVEVLAELGAVLHKTGSRAKNAKQLSPITAEGVIGAVLTVIHTRSLAKRPDSMIELLNPLMGVIVLPYLGAGAAEREQAYPPPTVRRPRVSWSARGGRTRDPLVGLPMRITHRTLLALAAIAANPGASNRQIATEAGVADQGQISKLLGRLERLELVLNTSEGQPSGEPNSWQLTARGAEVQRAVAAPSTDSRHEEMAQ